MKNAIIIILVVASTCIVSGCTGNAVYLKSTKTFTATDPKTIQVYATTDPSVKFEVIGYISTYTTDADRDGDRLKENLRIQAARFGANAIIGFKLNVAETGGGGAQGVAVRYLQ